MLETIFFIAVAAACPLMMLLCMRAMRSASCAAGAKETAEPSTESAPTLEEKVAHLERLVGELEKERAQLEGEVTELRNSLPGEAGLMERPSSYA